MNTFNEKKFVVLCDDSVFLTVCNCSCFDPNTRISIKNLSTGRTDLIRAGDLPLNGAGYGIQVVSEEGVYYLPFEVSSCEVREVFVFRFDNGSVLKVTEEHPVLLASGKMVQAREIVVGSQLLDTSKRPIRVEGISTEMSSGEVLNILVDEGQRRVPHTIIAEGVLVGDAQWQRKLIGFEPDGEE